MKSHNFIKLFLIVIILMFIISAGSIYATKNTAGFISFANVSFVEGVIPNANPLMFVFFLMLIAFTLVSFFTWASNQNVIEEDDYETMHNGVEFYRPNRDF
ncbi:MAG: hypothetical protein V1672_01215 [Candidatus Diapherotrites archaeon]